MRKGRFRPFSTFFLSMVIFLVIALLILFIPIQPAVDGMQELWINSFLRPYFSIWSSFVTSFVIALSLKTGINPFIVGNICYAIPWAILVSVVITLLRCIIGLFRK